MLWRRKLARERGPTPHDFLGTCQTTLASVAPSGPGWIHEVKHDGFRVLVRKQGDCVRIWSRHMTDLTDRFPRILKAVALLPGDAVIDGEAVVFHADGHSDFAALMGRRGADAILVAFALLQSEGADLRSLPFERRRAALAKQIILADDAILFSQAIEGEGATVYRHACSMGLEGIVSKRLGSKYRAGRSADWLKIKNPEWVRR